MSETIEQAAPEATEQPAVEQEAPAIEQEAAEPVEGVEQPAAETVEPEAPVEPEPEGPSKADRRFAQLTRRNAVMKAELDAAQRRAEAAEALLNANRPEGERQEQAQPHQQQSIEQAALRLNAERDQTARLAALVEGGRKEFGEAAWAAHADALLQLGAVGSPAFMETLSNVPNGAKLVAHLADDADAVIALLGKSPVAMAAEMGRMAAEISKPARALSNAPRPVARIDAPVVVRERTSADPDLTMAQYVAIRNAEIAKRKASGLR